MRRNSILIAFACITFLAGVGAAVELFGGNDVQFADGSGAASGGQYLYQSSNSLAIGINANAYATPGSKGNGSAAFTGSGSVTTFNNLTGAPDGRGFIQSVNYTGRVQAKVTKISTDGDANAYANVGASTYVSKSAADDEQVSGSAGISTWVMGNGQGTSAAVANGTAGYSAQYINKSDITGKTTSVKTSGIASGDAYMTSTNNKFTDGFSYGSAGFGTSSSAGNISGSSSYSSMNINTILMDNVDNGVSTVSGYANAIKLENYAWDPNRMSYTGASSLVPSSTNFNAYTKAIGNLSAGAKTYEKGDQVSTSSWESSSATHTATSFTADSHMYSNVNAVRAINNTTYRVEGTTFIDNGALNSITMGKLGSKLVAAESNIKTSNGGDNVGTGVLLSNRTSASGFGASATYDQGAVWDNTNKRFDMTTHFLTDTLGLNLSASTKDTGVVGARMNILGEGKKLNAIYGAGSTWSLFSTDIPQQKEWNYFAANSASLNHGETFASETFVPTGVETENSTTLVGRHYTREVDTSNPF